MTKRTDRGAASHSLERQGGVRRLLARADRDGCVELSNIEDLAAELSLEEDDRARVFELIEARGAVVRDDCGRSREARTTITTGRVAELTADTLGMFLDEIGRVPLLTAQDEIDLAKRIEAGDPSAKDRMILANLRLVVHWAKRYQHQGVALLDLIQEGIFGLVRAVEKFDWRRGFKFSTYASFWIRQSLQRALQNHAREIRLPGEVAERARRLQRAREELHRQLDHDPSDDELAAQSGLTLEQIRQLDEAARVVTSTDAPVGEEGDITVGDFLSSGTGTEELVHVSLEERALHEAVEALPEPHRTIIRRRYGLDGAPIGRYRLGRELRMSDARIRALEEEALTKLATSRELAA